MIDMNINNFLKDNQDVKNALESIMKTEELTEISLMTKGATNRSYLVRALSGNYVLRVPGKGSDEMIDRHLECEVYSLIKDCGISDKAVYINPENGIKISIYHSDSRFLNLINENEIKTFLKTVKNFHKCNIKCSAEYDFYENIQKYEVLRNSLSCFDDYEKVKNNIFSMKEFTDSHRSMYTLIHNDLSCENCLFFSDENNEDKCILIDFEYAAMQCPAADIAYFCVFSSLDETSTDKIIQYYYEDECDSDKYAQVYAYIALNAFLHSNWLEFKISLEDERKNERRQESVSAYNMAKLYYKKYKEASVCPEWKEQ